MGARVSLVELLATTALGGPVRTSLSALTAATRLGGPVRVGLHALTAATHLGGPTRVSGLYFLSVQKAFHNAFELNRLESTSSIDKFQGFGVKGYDILVVQAPTPEHNPYKPVIPETMREVLGPDGHNYLEENQETLREQHNLIQAGDTTFPYQLMIKPHDVAQYRLGAISRFYHEDYGIILARYVQFSDMAMPAYVAGPCGLVQKKKGQPLTWQVTNDIAKSSPHLAVGVLATYTIPANNQFGWIIVDGPNLQQMGYQNSDSVQLGETLAWSANGVVSPNADGRIIGRRVFRGNTTGLLAGYCYVTLESLSSGGIAALITKGTGVLATQVAQLQASVDILEELSNANVLSALRAEITLLRQKLSLEQVARAGADRAINDRISNLDAITRAQLDSAILALANQFSLDQDAQNVEIGRVRALAQSAYDAATAAGAYALAELTAEVARIRGLLEDYMLKPHGKFPIVDGSIPPNLMYDESGALLYEETF